MPLQTSLIPNKLADLKLPLDFQGKSLKILD